MFIFHLSKLGKYYISVILYIWIYLYAIYIYISIYLPTRLFLTRLSSQDLMEFLHTYGVKVNSADAKGRTALHVAAANDDVDGVCRLMEWGADVNIKDSWRAWENQPWAGGDENLPLACYRLPIFLLWFWKVMISIKKAFLESLLCLNDSKNATGWFRHVLVFGSRYVWLNHDFWVRKRWRKTSATHENRKPGKPLSSDGFVIKNSTISKSQNAVGIWEITTTSQETSSMIESANSLYLTKESTKTAARSRRCVSWGYIGYPPLRMPASHKWGFRLGFPILNGDCYWVVNLRGVLFKKMTKLEDARFGLGNHYGRHFSWVSATHELIHVTST